MPSLLGIALSCGVVLSRSSWSRSRPPRWPPIPQDLAAQMGSLRAAFKSGALEIRNLDPVPWPRHVLTTLNFSHSSSCTSCFDRKYRKSVHRTPFAPAPDVPELLWDDHGLSAHRCIVRVSIEPERTPIPDLQVKQPKRNKQGMIYQPFGMYGSVLRLGGTFRAWLGEKKSYIAESQDGLSWKKPRLIRKLWHNRQGVHAGSVFPNLCVTHDELRGRLLMAHSCGNDYAGGSIALAESPLDDGISWRPLVPNGTRGPFNMTGRGDDLPEYFAGRCGPVCTLGGDSCNCARWEESFGEYRIVKRMHFELPPDRWRAIRGVQVAANPDLNKDPRAFRELGHWYFDRTGKEEYTERQMYALDVARLPLADPDPEWLHPASVFRARVLGRKRASRAARSKRAPLYVGIATVLEWPNTAGLGPDGRASGKRRVPFLTDVATPYLLPTRDGGITADLDAVYAGHPLIPRRGCRNASLASCAWDHGYIQPASELLTVGSEHWLFYEGRRVNHHSRFYSRAVVALARWPLHRLVGLMASPRCQGTCGEMVTRPFRVPSARLQVNMDVRGSAASGPGALATVATTFARTRGHSADKHLPPVGQGSVQVEVLPPRGVEDMPPIHGFGLPDAVTLRVPSLRADVRWRDHSLQQLVGQLVRLRFTICGDARLFSLTFRRSRRDHASGEAGSSP